MNIQKAFKARIYLTNEQRRFLNKTRGKYFASCLFEGKSTSVGMEALAFGDAKSETAVAILETETEGSRNLVEQAERTTQATSLCPDAGAY